MALPFSGLGERRQLLLSAGRGPEHGYGIVFIAVCAAAFCAVAVGCGGGSSHSSSVSGAASGLIMIAGSSTAADGSVLAVGSTLRVSTTPANDSSDSGVDWTVTCSGNPATGSTTNGACGTLSPAHTADAAVTVFTAPSVVPVGTTVSLIATLSANPSVTSSASLTIVNSPVGVSFVSTSAPPVSLQVNTATPLNAQVTNDPSGAGLIWTSTCGSPACGSFNPAITASNSATIYTAPTIVPNNGTVTISATSLTDTSKSATATVTITSPPSAGSIGVSISPASLYVQTVGAAHNGQFTATVTGDTADAGVDWSLACGSASCGSITSHTASGGPASYSAPSSIPQGAAVTVTARATTNPAALATATADIVIAAPIVAGFSPAAPTSLTAAASTTLAATVTNDPSNAGLDWTATCGTAGACGSFSLSPAHTASGSGIVYTAPLKVPAGGVVTLTATPTSASGTIPGNPAIASVTILAPPPVITLTQAPPATLTAATQVSITASVANDAPPGGVTWSIAPCGSTVPGGCGWLAPVQTSINAATIYTAPPATATGTSVTLLATSNADPSVTLSTAPIAILPATALSVRFIPALASQLQPGSTVNLQAAVANDTRNAGVDWQVCPSGCGFFTVKPAVAAIPATSTTPYVPPVAAVTATSVAGWSNDLPIAYTAPTVAPDSGVVTVTAFAHSARTAAISGNITIDSQTTGPALTGLVQAGSQPVSGSTVALLAAGTSGYGSQASQLATVETNAQGSFSIPGGYACPAPTSQMYLIATGGAAGTGTTANPNLTLMTILGSCNALSSTPVVLNEVTSVASAYVVSPFAANDPLTGDPAALYLGASSSNQTGLANAFASVNNLVDITTGQARFVSPAGNAVVPYAQINTLADSLHACAATTGGVEGDGSPCGDLFTLTDVLLNNHALYNAIGPSDTLQAAFNAAQHPVTNYGYVLSLDLSLAGASSPFQPILTTAPSDWSLSLHYNGGSGGYSPASTLASMAVDDAGDLWFTDTSANTVIEWNNFGAAISPSTGFAAGGGPLAIDAAGNVWVSGNGALTELTPLGAPVAGSPFSGVAGGGVDMAIDAQGNVWIASSNGLNEWNSLGLQLSPAGGFGNGVTGLTSIGIDSANNVWAGYFNEFANPGGGLIVNTTQSSSSTLFPELAADASGDMWGANDGVCNAGPYGGRGSLLIPTCYSSGNAGPANGNLLLAYPQGLAFDGAGTLWVASQGGSSNPTIPPSVLPIAPSLLGSNSPNYLTSPSLAAGTVRVAVDGAGNVWVLLADNTVAEYVGVATPVVTPLALGIASGKLAAKP